MGVDFSATALIGVRVPREKLFRTVRAPNCPHKNPGNATYCAACGREAWADSRESVVDLGAYGFLVVETGGLDDDPVLVTLPSLSVRTDSHRSGCAPSLAPLVSGDIRGRVGDMAFILNKLGLWDASQFGLWAVANVSC